MFWEKDEIPSCALVPPGSVGFAGPAGGSYPTTKSIVAYREIVFYVAHSIQNSWLKAVSCSNSVHEQLTIHGHNSFIKFQLLTS